MIKTLCIFALIALCFCQDIASAVQDNSQTIQDTVNSVVGDQTVAQAVDTAAQTLNDPNVVSSTASNLPNISDIENITIGWGNQNILVSSFDNEYLLTERVAGGAGEGEWTLNWNDESGNQWALWNDNGELVVVDLIDGVWNTVSNLGSDQGLEGQISAGAEQFVNYVWNNETLRNISYSAAGSDAQNLLNNALSNDDVNNWLAQQGQSTDATVSDVVSQVVSDPQQAIDTAQNIAGSQ